LTSQTTQAPALRRAAAFFSPARGENTTWQIRADSIQIANRTATQATDDGKPARFRLSPRSGVSDHWPLVLNIEPTEKQ